jgi:putative glutathione S-transferase
LSIQLWRRRLAFSDYPGSIPDNVNGTQYLRDVYIKADPKFTGRVTVPVLWDKKTNKIVNNESRDIIGMLDTELAILSRIILTSIPELQKKIEETIDAIISRLIMVSIGQDLPHLKKLMRKL